MSRFLSPILFSANFSELGDGGSRAEYEVRSAREVGFKEDWLQNAIVTNPELVIAPCREAELTDEQWWFWAREFPVAVGPVDVLLVSEGGRVGIVETKLSYNPESRRSVLAQLLDYAVSLPDIEPELLPPLPTDSTGLPVAGREQVEEHIQRGDFLLFIAGDRVDDRVVKLSRSLLGDHMVNEWELALVELAVFAKRSGAEGPEHLLVPHLRGLVEPEFRQVVKVLVDSDGASKVTVERLPPEAAASGRERWTEERFFAALETGALSAPFKDFGMALRGFREQFPGIEISWGRGRVGSATLKRHGGGLAEFYLNGRLAFRKEKFVRALGEPVGHAYLEHLQRLFPEAMRRPYPYVVAAEAEPRLDRLVAILSEVLERAGEL